MITHDLAVYFRWLLFFFKLWPAHAVIPTCKPLSQCSQTASPGQGVPLALWFHGFQMLSVFTAHFGGWIVYPDIDCFSKK